MSGEVGGTKLGHRSGTVDLEQQRSSLEEELPSAGRGKSTSDVTGDTDQICNTPQTQAADSNIAGCVATEGAFVGAGSATGSNTKSSWKRIATVLAGEPTGAEASAARIALTGGSGMRALLQSEDAEAKLLVIIQGQKPQLSDVEAQALVRDLIDELQQIYTQLDGTPPDGWGNARLDALQRSVAVSDRFGCDPVRWLLDQRTSQARLAQKLAAAENVHQLSATLILSLPGFARLDPAAQAHLARFAHAALANSNPDQVAEELAQLVYSTSLQRLPGATRRTLLAGIADQGVDRHSLARARALSDLLYRLTPQSEDKSSSRQAAPRNQIAAARLLAELPPGPALDAVTDLLSRGSFQALAPATQEILLSAIGGAPKTCVARCRDLIALLEHPGFRALPVKQQEAVLAAFGRWSAHAHPAQTGSSGLPALFGALRSGDGTLAFSGVALERIIIDLTAGPAAELRGRANALARVLPPLAQSGLSESEQRLVLDALRAGGFSAARIEALVGPASGATKRKPPPLLFLKGLLPTEGAPGLHGGARSQLLQAMSRETSAERLDALLALAADRDVAVLDATNQARVVAWAARQLRRPEGLQLIRELRLLLGQAEFRAPGRENITGEARDAHQGEVLQAIVDGQATVNTLTVMRRLICAERFNYLTAANQKALLVRATQSPESAEHFPTMLGKWLMTAGVSSVIVDCYISAMVELDFSGEHGPRLAADLLKVGGSILPLDRSVQAFILTYIGYEGGPPFLTALADQIDRPELQQGSEDQQFAEIMAIFLVSRQTPGIEQLLERPEFRALSPGERRNALEAIVNVDVERRGANATAIFSLLTCDAFARLSAERKSAVLLRASSDADAAEIESLYRMLRSDGLATLQQSKAFRALSPAAREATWQILVNARATDRPAVLANLEALIDFRFFEKLSADGQLAILSQAQHHPNPLSLEYLRRLIAAQWLQAPDGQANGDGLASIQRSAKMVAGNGAYIHELELLPDPTPGEFEASRLMRATMEQILPVLSSTGGVKQARFTMEWKRLNRDETYGEASVKRFSLNAKLLPADNEPAVGADARYLFRHVVVHEVNHLMNRDEVAGSFEYLMEEYGAWYVGFKAENRRDPTPEEGYARLYYLLTSTEGAYRHLGDALDETGFGGKPSTEARAMIAFLQSFFAPPPPATVRALIPKPPDKAPTPNRAGLTVAPPPPASERRNMNNSGRPR